MTSTDKFCISVQLLFKPYATRKLFRLYDYGDLKYGMESQGMDMYQSRYIFQGSDNTGNLVSLAVIDAEKKKILGDFALKLPKCHMNNINIGEMYRNEAYPSLYISECKNKQRCFIIVPNAKLDGYKLLQTIYFKSEKHYGGSKYPFDWFKGDKFIYTFGMTGVDNEMEICKFPLPKVNDNTEVIFTDKDIKDSFKIGNCCTYQGTKIVNGKLYALSGLDTKECPTYLKVIDLEKHKVEKDINIKGLEELEAISVYEDGFIVVNGAYNPTYTFLKLK